jgi:YcxB-like protein
VNTTRIRFSLSASDYHEFERTYRVRFASFWERNLFKIFVSFGLIVIAAGLNWMYYLHRDKYYGSVCILGGSYLIWHASWIRFWRGRRWFARNRHLYENLEAEISEAGLTLRTDTEEVKQSWKHYLGYTETEHLFVLSVPLDSSVILPKRAFEPGELAAFGDLLRRKVSETH